MKLDHVTVLTDDVDVSTAFYRDMLGLVPGPRPPFSFAGAWLYAEGRAIVHLRAPNPGGARSGPLEHVAFETRDFDGAVLRLAEAGIPHRLQVLPDGSRRQCFLSDPNGVLIEIVGS